MPLPSDYQPVVQFTNNNSVIAWPNAMPVNEFVKPGTTIVTNDLTNFLDWLSAGATAAQGACNANYTGDLVSNLSSNNATYHSGYNNGQNGGYDGYNNSYKSGNLNANYSGNNTNYCDMQH